MKRPVPLQVNRLSPLADCYTVSSASQVRGRLPTGEPLEREDIRMRHGRCLAAFLGVLLWGAAGQADITNTTPYDYDAPPRPGKERGTYMAAGTGSLGPDCFFTCIGTAKYLPNPDGSRGKH